MLKIWMREVAIRFDGPSTPRDRLLVEAEVIFPHACGAHPDMSRRVAWTEAQGLDDVGPGFLRATDEDLTKPDTGMGLG
jgi:hypothetical protein